MNKNELITAADEVIAKGDSFMAEATKFIECVGVLLTAVKALRAILAEDTKEAGHE